MRRTKEEALLTREKLLSTALRVFSQKGFSATRLEDIAQAAGLTRGAIYHHFGGKEELFGALVTERETGINQMALETVAQGGTPADKLRRLLVQLLRYLEENQEYRSLLALTLNRVELSGSMQPFADQMTQSRRSLTDFFEDLIEKGIESGVFKNDISAHTAALVLTGSLNGLALIWVQDPDSFSISQRAEDLVEILLGSLLV